MPTLSTIDLVSPPGGSRGLTGVLGVPDGPGPFPGVVMIHEAFGVTPVMRRQVERSAAAGFLTLMPDLYTEGGTRACLLRTFRDIARGRGRAFVDAETARRTLVDRADCTGRTGVLGFCMGGGFALVAAKGRGFEAASVNYGRLPGALDDLLAGACPVVGSFGGRDHSLRGAAKRLDDALVRAGVPHDVEEYPTAGHAFLDDEPFETGPLFGLALERVLHAGPDPVAAADAWARIDAFFGRHLAA